MHTSYYCPCNVHKKRVQVYIICVTLCVHCWPPVVAGDPDEGVWDEAAVTISVDRTSGSGGVPARGKVV